MAPRIYATKEKINKLDLIKTENFSVSRDTVKSEMTTHRIGEKFVSHASDKGPIPRIH